MIGDIVDVEEERPVAALALDNLDGLIEIETVGLEIRGAEVAHVQIMRDADRRLEGTRAEKSTVERIEAEGLVAATAQRQRQASIDVSRGDPGDGRRETSVGTGRKAGEHIVLGEPAWSADALDDELARLAVQRLEMMLIAGWHFYAWRDRNVETRFIVQQDNVREFARRMTSRGRRQFQASGHSCV